MIEKIDRNEAVIIKAILGVNWNFKDVDMKVITYPTIKDIEDFIKINPFIRKCIVKDIDIKVTIKSLIKKEYIVENKIKSKVSNNEISIYSLNPKTSFKNFLDLFKNI